MNDYTGENVYTRLGARPVINAAGNTTVWGGSVPSPVVKQAMDEASMSFVAMEELLERAGQHIARQLGVDAAYPTAGCYAALVLSTAACISGNDPGKAAQLPDTTGMKSEVVLQQSQRYGYDRAYTVPGSTLVPAGNDDGCTPDELEAAIGPNTAAVAYLVNKDQGSAVVSLEDAVHIAHEHDVPLIADAAAQIYPVDYFRRNAQSADLVCFGGKYMGAPHSAGYVCGKADLIEAVAAHGFIGPQPFGRAMKMDRQEIVGLVAAIDGWLTMDHEERLIGYGDSFSVIESGLEGVPTVRKAQVAPNNSYVGLQLDVVLDTEAYGNNASHVVDELDQGSPRIRVTAPEDDTVTINVHNLAEGDDQIIADRLRAVLTS